MRRCLLWIVGMTPALALADPDGPVRWSSDGRWAAYAVVLRADRPEASTGWVDRDGPSREGRDPGKAPAEPGPLPYRIYAANRETGASTLLEASRWPLSSPEWGPDGRALAFVRIAVGPDGSARQDVVVQDGPTDQRVLVSRPADAASKSAEVLARHAPAWSPDGRFLAVPSLDGSVDLTVVRADNGRVVKAVKRASRPAWSPDGSRLAFRSEGPSGSAVLWLVDTSFGPPRRLADLGPVDHAPVWARDGKSLMAVARHPNRLRRGPTQPVQPVELTRIEPDTGSVETVANFAGEPSGPANKVRGLSFGLDREWDDLFWTIDVEGQPSVLVWFRPRTGETVNRFNPLDFSARIGSVSVAPDGKSVALRFGPPGASAAVALFDPASSRLTPVVPDDPARSDWLAFLLETGRDLARLGSPPAAVDGRGVPRPTVLPVPGEIPVNQEVAARLRTVGRLGNRVCERPDDAPPAPAELCRFLAEGKLLAGVFLEDYRAAADALSALEARTTSPEARLNLLTVRAQLLMGQGNWDRAADTVAYLKTLEARRPTRIEVTPAGFALADAPEKGWASYLDLRLNDLRKARNSPGGEPALGHRNPDAPETLPLARFPDPAFLPGREAFDLQPAPRDDDPDVRVRFRPVPNRPGNAPAPPEPAPPPTPRRRVPPGR